MLTIVVDVDAGVVVDAASVVVEVEVEEGALVVDVVEVDEVDELVVDVDELVDVDEEVDVDEVEEVEVDELVDVDPPMASVVNATHAPSIEPSRSGSPALVVPKTL